MSRRIPAFLAWITIPGGAAVHCILYHSVGSCWAIWEERAVIESHAGDARTPNVGGRILPITHVLTKGSSMNPIALSDANLEG